MNEMSYATIAAAVISQSVFDCPICLETAKNAVETDCCHALFCEPCLDTDSPCPHCRSVPPLGARPSVAVRRIIGNLPAKCPHAGCLATVTIATVDEHAAKCQLTCPFELCTATMPASLLDAHKATCEFKPYACPALECGFEGLADDFLWHLFEAHKSVVLKQSHKLFATAPDLEDLLATTALESPAATRVFVSRADVAARSQQALWDTATSEAVEFVTATISYGAYGRRSFNQRPKTVSSLHIAFVFSLKASNIIQSDEVLRAMLYVDRCYYCQNPYKDDPQPLGFGATISAPHVYAKILEALRSHLKPGATACDIGCGAGYLTTTMALLVGPTGRVLGLESVNELVKRARTNICNSNGDVVDSKCVRFQFSDARKFWASVQLPLFDVIHVAGSVGITVAPEELISLLKPGGRMIVAVGPQNGKNPLQQVDKDLQGGISSKDFLCLR